MQVPAEDGGKRGGIERQIAFCTFHREAEAFVQILPLGTGKIRIRQRDAMRAVAHPIHQAQRPVVERTFSKMVFDEQEFSTDAAGVVQDRKWVAGVVQDVHKQAAIEGTIGKRQVRTIECPAGNGAIATREHFEALDFEFRHRVAKECGESPIAAAYVEEPTPRWEHRRKLLRQYCDSPLVHHLAMDFPDELGARVSAHRARNPQYRCPG